MDPEFRESVLRRDNWSCQAPVVEFHPEVRCSRRLHAHHRELTTKRDELDNVVTLCDEHHRWVHDVDRAGAEAAGLITRRGAVHPA